MNKEITYLPKQGKRQSGFHTLTHPARRDGHEQKQQSEAYGCVGGKTSLEVGLKAAFKQTKKKI